MHSEAYITPDGYRYWLIRRWDDEHSLLGFIMLNPSTADASVDDPTIRKCMHYAKANGYSGIYVTNLFARQATDPRDLLKYSGEDIQGPGNNAAIEGMTLCCKDVVCAWGAPTGALGRLTAIRAQAVMAKLLYRGSKTWALKLTKEGRPGHPLYLRKDLQLTPYRETVRL